MTWRQNFQSCEKNINFDNLLERDFDMWFLSRYLVSEKIRIQETKAQTNSLKKKKFLCVFKLAIKQS